MRYMNRRQRQQGEQGDWHYGEQQYGGPPPPPQQQQHQFYKLEEGEQEARPISVELEGQRYRGNGAYWSAGYSQHLGNESVKSGEVVSRTREISGLSGEGRLIKAETAAEQQKAQAATAAGA